MKFSAMILFFTTCAVMARVEPPLPAWDAEEMLKGGWLAGGVLPHEEPIMDAEEAATLFIDLHVYVFAANQRVLGNLREEEIMERMTQGTAVETMDSIPVGEVPSNSNGIIAVVQRPVKLAAWMNPVGVVTFFVSVGLLALGSALMWWRSKARLRFPEFDVEPRLGGSHAAGIGAVISFGSPAIPPAMQRNQLPCHLRRT